MVQSELNTEDTRLPLTLRSGGPSSGETHKDKPKSTDEMFNEVMQTLKQNLQLEGAARATKAYSTEQGTTEPRSGTRPFEELVEAGKLFGINFGDLVARRDEEVQALREATEAKDKEIHELRLKELNQWEERIKNAAVEMAKLKEGEKGRGLGGFLGLDGLDPDVKKRIEERVFGLTPPDKAGDGAAQIFPFSREWFAQWGELKPGIEAFVRMLGYIPRDEGGTNKQEPLVSMTDMATGKVPLELALGLRRLELENKREELRLDREHQRETKKMDILGDIGTTLKQNVPDAIAALRDIAGEHNRAAQIEGSGGAEVAPQSRPKGIKCSECGEEFAVLGERDQYICPNPECRAELMVPGREVPAPPEESAA